MATSLEKKLAALAHWKQVRERILASRSPIDEAMLQRVERQIESARVKVRVASAHAATYKPPPGR